MSALSDNERAVLLGPCDCGHTINDHGELVACWACEDEEQSLACVTNFEALLVERVAWIVAERANADPAWITEQRCSGWPDMHPEDYCHRCGAPNPSWYTDRDTWLAATSGWAAETGREGICCPACLIALHEQATGERVLWELVKR